MQFTFKHDTELDTLAKALHEFDLDPNNQSLVLFGCDENNWNKEELNSILNETATPIIGGIFPQIIHDAHNAKQGFLLIGLQQAIQPFLVHGLSDNSVDFEQIITELIADDIEFSSMLVLVDGLATRISGLLDGLFSVFGADIHYIGGGAGSLSFDVKPCVFTNEGVFQEAAVLGLIPHIKAVHVGHGWEPLNTGHIATSIEKNVIKEIDYKNAFSVYQEILNPHIQPKEFHADNFFEIAQSFPIGIKKLDGGYVVRDPISVTDDGHLVCVGELSEGDQIDILQGHENTLISAAKSTAESAAKQASDVEGVLLMDCISRALFLNENFQQELAAVASPFFEKTPVNGALVLGEIANSGSGYLEFYNKTTVVSLL